MSPLANTSLARSFHLSWMVWKGLFFREALSRLFSSRGAWFWLFAEPLFHIGYMMLIFAVVRVRHVGGMDTLVWLALGFLSFFMFTRTWTQVSNAVSANKALFTYRQVRAIDTCLTRSVLELFLMCCLIILVFLMLALMGFRVIPDQPLKLGLAWIGLWLLGMMMGLLESVLKAVVPEIGKVFDFLSSPLYFVSGIIIPLASIPHPYQGWLLLNPVAHGVVLSRSAFSNYYHAAPEVSMQYLYLWVLLGLIFSLVLHRRFAEKMMSQ